MMRKGDDSKKRTNYIVPITNPHTLTLCTINNKHLLILLTVIILTLSSCKLEETNLTGYISDNTIQLDKINLKESFNIEIFAENINNPRSLALGNNKTIYAGSKNAGNVYKIKYNENMKVANIETIASNLNMPNGISYNNNQLYVVENNRIILFKTPHNSSEYVIINENLPNENHHGWRYSRIGPDGKLYISIGAPCNICEKEEPFATISRLNNDNEIETYVKGVRNSVGFDWDNNGRLWFTDNGRDWLGDDIPGDELNRADAAGLHFGFPYCHNNDLKDPDYNKGKDCQRYTEPKQILGPHVAALGMRFNHYSRNITNNFPLEYNNTIFIAEHGSWNRKVPIGYRITIVKLDTNNNPTSYNVFADGWLNDDKAWGRPVDILFLEDGSMLISDDKANAIYRIYYKD